MSLEDMGAWLDTHRARDASVVGWQLSEVVGERAQRLYRHLSGGLVPHQTRTVRERTLRLKMWVQVGDRMGFGEVDLDPSLAFEPQCAVCQTIAASSDNHPWSLPEPPERDYPEVETADPGILEDPQAAADRLEVRLQRAVRAEDGVCFNSAELYVSALCRRMVTHTGIDCQHASTEIVLDLAGEPLPGPNLQEVHDGLEGVGVDAFDLEAFVSATAREARLLGGTREPASSDGAKVLIGTRALAELFTALAACLSAHRAFLKLGSLEVGEAVHTGALRGDRLGMTLDPFLPHMVRSSASTRAGQVPRRGRVIEDSQVVNRTIDHRYGQYLGLAPNHIGGNVVVDAGSVSTAALRERAPGVIEVLSFSGLVVSRAKLTWSSEIKLGRQWDADGVEHWLRGGLVSGDFRANLAHMHLSSEIGVVNDPERFGVPAIGYRGPAAMLIHSGVTVAGSGR